MKDRKNIEVILEKIENLPALPQIADEALRILNNENSSKSDLVKIISKDQSFISKILAIANSPVYGLRKEVSTMSFAVFVLGLKEIKKIVFALAFIKSFKMEKSKYFNPEAFWLHSFVVGNLSRRIALDLDITNSGEAFVIGFLHDLAISIMHQNFNEEFNSIIKKISEGEDYETAEKSELNITHAEMASVILEKWSLPNIIVDSINHHHHPTEAKYDKTLASVVHLADYITFAKKIAKCECEPEIELDESIIEILEFDDRESLDEFIDSYEEYIHEQIDSVRNLL